MKRFVTGKITHMEKLVSKSSENEFGLSISHVKTMITLDNNKIYESDDVNSTIKEGQKIGLYLNREGNAINAIVNEKTFKNLIKRHKKSLIYMGGWSLFLSIAALCTLGFPITDALRGNLGISSLYFIMMSFVFLFLTSETEKQRKQDSVSKEDKNDMQKYIANNNINDDEINIIKETQLSKVL